MDMEGLPLRLCHSHYTSLPPVYCLRFPFLFFIISISCLASSSRACPGFTCGKDFFPYPFGEVKSGCGDPALQLQCDREVNMALINISGYQYYLWDRPDLWEEDHIMTVIDTNMWNDRCNPWFSNHTTEIWSSLRFSFARKYRNLTLWECPDTVDEKLVSPLACNNSWYLNVTEDLSFVNMCKSQVTFLVPDESFQIPVREEFLHAGFRIKWNANKLCTDCEHSGGLCAYNISSAQIYCDSTKSVAIGTIALLLTGVLLVFVCRKRWLSTSSKKPDLSNVEKFLQDYVHQMPIRYSFSHLKKITKNFANKVGEGGFGVVYKGQLSTGNLVAVKMVDQSRHSENQFMNEVVTLRRIHHVHLVRLMGYCYEEHRNALVYEYMANGSLDEFIFARRKKEAILNLAQLYSIALGAAHGIAYLHQDCDNCIIHFDIKPHNILLDEEFTPKVADFGLAKLCGKREDHISMTTARGTPGYVAPEVWNRNLGAITDKSDVYSFGMVLLEMVGGRKNIDVQVSRSSQFYFLEWAFKLMENGKLERGLRGSGKVEIECEEKEKAIRLAKIGLWCIQYNSTD